MRTFRTTSWVMMAALALGVSTASAQELPVGLAVSKNLVERTITIDDQVYRVGSDTRLVDRNGKRIQLSQVVTEADLGGRVDLDQVTYAYDANGSALVLLQAVEARH
jgi:hypothetical protein